MANPILSKLVLAILLEQGSLTTRLRETSRGDLHDVPHQPGLEGLALNDILDTLEVTEKKGVILRSELVHEWDTSEYKVTWKLKP